MTSLVDEPTEVVARAAASPRHRVTWLVDLLTLTALALFAAWTLWYLLALAGVMPSSAAFWAWVITSPAVVALVVTRLRPLLQAIPATAPWVPLAVSGFLALGSVVVVRPDLDDASYVVRSTWIAAHGDVRVGDVIFSGGHWPGIPAQTPYLPSVEALFGWLSRVSGISAGTVVYVLVPPVATFLGIWALSMVLRSWRARNAGAALLLAALFLVLGGATHASWGNLNFARIWQGKVLLLAVAVPLLFALAAAFWTSGGRPMRRAALVATGLAGIAAVGLSPAATFVAPAVVLVCLVPGLLQRRWLDAAILFVAGAGPGLVAGLVHLGATPGATATGLSSGNPWLKVLGTGAPAVVSVVAALVAVLGWCVPRTWAACATVGRSTAAASVCAGVLLCIPGVYDLAIRVMGTDAIAWRLTWVVPVPILVGLLAGLPRWSQVRAGALVGGLAAVALVWGGLPVWSASNAAWGARPPAWKVYPADLGAARWVAAQQNSGRVLAPAGVVAALGVVTADARPVGSRVDYMVNYSDLPGTRMPQRLLLQRLAEGGSDAADVAAAPAALSALRVWVACTLPGDVLAHEVLQPQGYVLRFREGPLACWSGGRAFSDGTGGR